MSNYYWNGSKQQWELRLDKNGHRGLTIISDIEPFVTEHISGKKILVKSRRHLKNVLKQHRLVEYSVNSDAKSRKISTNRQTLDWRLKS